MKRDLKQRVTLALVGACALMGLVGPAFAEGTETLGPANIPIATGTGIVGAGAGMVNFSTVTVHVIVPPGVTVKQVLAYWEGQSIAPPLADGAALVKGTGAALVPAPGDSTAIVNGHTVQGTLIGGPTVFFTLGNDEVASSAFRADITSLDLIAPGDNVLTVEGLDDFNHARDGFGILVIFDDGSTPTNIQVRDGDDLAFINFAPPLQGTVAQTFNFASSPVTRTGNLVMLFGSVKGLISGSGPHRPNSIDVTIGGGAPQHFSDMLGSANGDEWDTLTLPITIPAGETSMTVQAFSRDDLGSGDLPASFAWVGAGLSVAQPCSGSIGDFVWNDLDRDGIQDAGEPGIPNVKLILKNGANQTVGMTTTNASGLYLFSGLCPGTYTVTVDATTLPPGLVPSPCNAGADDSKDNDCSPATVVLPNNATDLTIDFGYNTPSTVGKTFTIGPSSMEGHLTIRPGDWISGGFSFKFKNSVHPATSFTVASKATIAVTCPQGGGAGGTIVVDLGTKVYPIPANNTSWLPTGDANSVLSWMGSVQAPDLCGGHVMDNARGALYTATVSQNPPSGSLVDFRFKYRDPNAKGKGNVNCLDTSDPRRAKADVCGASWSQTVLDP